jgi:5'-3' exoribonuclease 2
MPPTPVSAKAMPTMNDPDADDKVRLWEPGWRERYYGNKFGVYGSAVKKLSDKVALAYMEGLCWVLQYYYRVGGERDRCC